MIQKDYLLRLFQLLIDAMHKIWNNIENGETELAKFQISETYKLLGESAEYFLKTNLDEIIELLSKKNQTSLTKLQLLSELMYYDSMIQKEKPAKLQLKKAIELAEYYALNTNEYSLENNNRLLEMKDKLTSI